MNKILIDAVLAILLFLFVWHTLGKPLVRWSSSETDVREPDVDPTDAVALKELKVKLTERLTKLKNKREIAQLRKQLNEVNAALADLA